MVERNDCVRFLLKPLQALGVAGKAHGQEFERSFTARGNVGRQIDVTHPAAADPLGNFVVTEGLTDEQVSLPISNDSHRNASSWGFDEAAYAFTRSEERFNFAAQKPIALAGVIQKCSDLIRLLIVRCTEDFLNRLKS